MFEKHLESNIKPVKFCPFTKTIRKSMGSCRSQTIQSNATTPSAKSNDDPLQKVIKFTYFHIYSYRE